ncbi:non-hydrolyzing UDP-N-acetylglucosamine 2-epimerase [Salinarimonas sp. NSM]|uniref:non-hydrolyzing UDP-N-acetylglucosamine 2-epimerase n=1 Tax=Salinarimonas sp. NSM TaxID=3458003 RepID=UPI004035933E
MTSHGGRNDIRVLTVFGTRPEAIKMAPVVRRLAAAPGVTSQVCVTAQHREMLDQVLGLFRIVPDFDLNVMRAGQTLTSITAEVIGGMQGVLETARPDLVLVHGDTTTTFACSLAAFYAKVAVGHVEAGLRTGDIYAPWPEEMNRRLTGAIARRHWAPTERARANLLAEGVSADAVSVVGNTVVDALLDVVAQLRADAPLRQSLDARFSYLDPTKRLVLVTSHRRENFGTGMEQLCLALRALAARGDVQIVWPIHPNPQVKEPATRLLSGEPNIVLIEPQDYLPFVYLMEKCYLLVSDSGGVQEEAPSLGKPVLVLRDVTERPEAVEAGTVELVGTDRNRIVAASERLLTDAQAYARMARAHNPYGDGRAAERIVESIIRGTAS